jgi:hypothetical protein
VNVASNKAIEGFVSYKLSLLSRLINRRSTRYFAEEFNMTLAEWRCLVQIVEGFQSIIALRKSENEAVVDLLTPDQKRVFFDSLDLLMAKFAQDEISYEG